MKLQWGGVRPNIVAMDNNVIASDFGLEQIKIIADKGYSIDFNQGLDCRLITDEIADLLARCKWSRYIRVACDHHSQMKHVENTLKLLRKYGYKKELFVYCLLRDFEESYERMKWIYSFKGDITPHCQGYIDFSGKKDIPQWQKDMMRWANKRWLYKTMWVDDYEPRKGFKFKDYLKQYNYGN